MPNNRFPEVDRLQKKVPQLWINSRWLPAREALPALPLGMKEIEGASQRLDRFAPLLADLFPQLEPAGGIIESGFRRLPRLEKSGLSDGAPFPGTLWIKADHELPVAGSIKARGGFYAVLVFAEKLARGNGLLAPDGDYRTLASPACRAFFGRYELSVASTGNLGLSIGIMGAALGFKVTVHMSVEAKAWKKERLRKRGVRVVEHASDYTHACSVAAENARRDPFNYYIDDENSVDLLLGYSVAVLRLKGQLAQAGVEVSAARPLFLYLPCGVGGAPGGITLAARHVFGDHAHCFFAEPTAAPCMFLGLLTGKHDAISVYDIGLDLKTDADGLAVSRPSRLVGRLVERLVRGAYTFSEEEMDEALLAMYEQDGEQVEPSAAVGALGPRRILQSEEGRAWLAREQMDLNRAAHVIWTTGGSLVPPEQHAAFRQKAMARKG